MIFITPVIVISFLSLYVLVLVYLERKVAAFIQDRLGPYEVGPRGLLQTVADMLKLLQKTDIFPNTADKLMFSIAPIILFILTFIAFGLLPYHNAPESYSAILILLAIFSIDILGFLLTGWVSSSRYPLLGSLRAISQMIAYEVPLTIIFLSIILISGTLDLKEIELQQESFSGIVSWNIIKYPFLIVGFIVFFIASLAESNRAPFDLPEAESELVAGYNTEYSGFRWSLFFFVEYEQMLLFSLLIVIIFFGGGSSPLPDIGNVKLHSWTTGILWKYFWWIIKSMPLLFLQLWIRWSYPRLRPDQLITLAWKILLPIALVILFFSILVFI